jgi:hypothetical protein
MKKLIPIIAIVTVASQLHAADLNDMVSRMAHDLNIRVVHMDDSRHVRAHHLSRRDHAVRQAVHRHHRHAVVRKSRATHKQAHKLSFHSLSEYRDIRNRHQARRGQTSHHHGRKSFVKHNIHSGSKRLSSYVGNGWYSDDDGYYNEEWEDLDYRNDHSWSRHRVHKQHGYRHYRRQWYLTYLYERSSFYDTYGFYYGDFDRYGFMFDGRWYGYDYNYTYQDRLHGKGIFEHRYYRPISYRYRHMARDDYQGGDEGFSFRVSFK